MCPIVTVLFIFISLGLFLFVSYLKKINQYWSARNVIFVKPNNFIFGSFKEFFFGTKSDFEIIEEIYRKHNDVSYVGFFQGTTPTLLLRDPEVIKHILVKDFNKFVNRGIFIHDDDVLAQNVLFVSEKKWKLLRQKLTPIFTSGKLKNMMPLISESCENFQKYLNKHMKEGTSIDVRAAITDFFISVITSCTFGIDSKTLSDEETPFRIIGRQFFEKNPKINKVIMLGFIWPSFFNYFNYSRFRNIDNLFIKIFKDILTEREKSNIKRNDMIDLCLELKKERVLKDAKAVGDYSLKVTDDLIAAQAFFFYLAGQETSETTITFSLYELAHNKIILKKVHNEIDKLLAKYGNMSYECLNEAVYMERVIKESQRKYPPIANLTRICSSEYALPDGKLKIEKDCLIVISVLGMHRDEKFFSNPSKFDPDRFLDSTIENGYYYFPFGAGPRQCLGTRLAMLQVKAGIFTLLQNFTLDSEEEYEPYVDLQPIFLATKPKKYNVQIVPRVM